MFIVPIRTETSKELATRYSAIIAIAIIAITIIDPAIILHFRNQCDNSLLTAIDYSHNFDIREAMR